MQYVLFSFGGRLLTKCQHIGIFHEDTFFYYTINFFKLDS